MFSCDYNGWADVPEEEREGIDCFELGQCAAAAQLWIPLVINAEMWPHEVAERRAA